jgi:hypothetical protein
LELSQGNRSAETESHEDVTMPRTCGGNWSAVAGVRTASRGTVCLNFSLSYMLARRTKLESLELVDWKGREWCDGALPGRVGTRASQVI